MRKTLTLIFCGPVIALASATHASDPQPRAASTCEPRDAFTGTVRSVADGRTLVLDDGREILLAGVETPGAWARDALPAMVSGQPVTISPVAAEPDRYGRLPAHVFLAAANGNPRLLGAEMVKKGLAFAGLAPSAGKDRPGCMAVLLAAESAARKQKGGIWNDPDYATKAADNPTAILGAKGGFAVIEGKVISVRESGGTIYVNFGRRWSEDFTVTVSKRLGARFNAAGMEVKRLEGRMVRVRGFIEERGGPWIEATAPEQIEVVEGQR